MLDSQTELKAPTGAPASRSPGGLVSGVGAARPNPRLQRTRLRLETTGRSHSQGVRLQERPGLQTPRR